MPRSNPFYRYIETLFHSGVTGGCGSSIYCPANPVTRGQMAVFLLVAKYGTGYSPPPATGTVFSDVPGYPSVRALDRTARRGGDHGGLRRRHVLPEQCRHTRHRWRSSSSWRSTAAGTPPPATGTVFSDVPASHPFARWIEQLVAEGITAGCGGGMYCPANAVTRGQMAVFLTVTFGLQLYGP